MTPQGWVGFRAKLDGAPTGLCIAPSWSGRRLRADAPCVHPRASRLPWPWPLSRRSAGRAPGEPHGVSAVWAWGHRRPGLLGFQAVAMGSMFLFPQMAFPVATRAAFLKGRLTGFENRFPVPRLSRAALHVRLRHRCDPLCSPFPSRVGPHTAPGLRTRQTKPTKVPELLGPPARPSPGAAEPDGPSAEAPRAGGGPSPRPPPRVPRAPLRSLPRPGVPAVWPRLCAQYGPFCISVAYGAVHHPSQQDKACCSSSTCPQREKLSKCSQLNSGSLLSVKFK